MTLEKYIGLPTMALLPLVNVEFSPVKDLEIKIPRSGSYAALAPKIFDDSDGEFNVLDKDNNTLYLPSISKILLACGKYPTLTSNQVFSIHALVIENDEVIITGTVLEIFRVLK